MNDFDRAPGVQSPRQNGPGGQADGEPASLSTGSTVNPSRLAYVESDGKSPQALVLPQRRFGSDRDAAAVLGIGERTLAELIAQGVEWLPQSLVLGPRLRRWDLDELVEVVRARAPRGARAAEPAQLRRARIERAKKTGDLQPAGA